MLRQSAAVSARAPDVESSEPAPEWLTNPANDLVVLSSEPFDGALRVAPATRQAIGGRLRRGGLITTATSGLAIAAAATVLTIGWFSWMDAPSSANLSNPTVSKSPGLPMTQQGSAQAESPAPELVEGINALRSRMQTAQAAFATPAARIDVAIVEEPETVGHSVAAADAITAASNAATPVTDAVIPVTEAAIPAIEAAASQPKMPPDEIHALLERAKGLIAVGDIAAARRLAEYVSASGDGGALFLLATTFDPKQLARWRVRGVRGDIPRARDLYLQASQHGIAEAQSRLAALP